MRRGRGLVAAAAGTMIVSVTVSLLWADPWSVVLLAVLGVAVVLVSRAYLNLAERHRSLEALHALASHVRPDTDPARAVPEGAGERVPSDPSRPALAAELSTAVTDDRLEVHFQPKVDVRTGAVTSAEALVRWNHASWGWLPPNEFVPTAESTDMIGPLTLNVVRRSLDCLRHWRGLGHDMTVAVNLSPRNLSDPHFADDVGALVVDVGLEPDRLVLELTESSVISDDERSVEVLEQLQALGIQLSIDDFGTGYSSLAHLRRLPISEIKVDKSFVSAMAGSEPDATIVRAILSLGDGLGLRTVAEGIETRETWDLLLEAGCRHAQGYLISRPLPVEQFEQWLVRHPVARADGEILTLRSRGTHAH